MSDFIIDGLDHKILDRLKVNARVSYAEVGRLVGLSPSAVRERIQKLEDRGVILNYCISIDQKLLGNDIKAFILVKVYHGKLKAFMNYVSKLPEVEKAFRITGEQNVHLQVVLRSQTELQQLIDKFIDFGATETHIVLAEISSKQEVISPKRF